MRTFNGTKKENNKKTDKTKICPKCGGVVMKFASECGDCDYRFIAVKSSSNIVNSVTDYRMPDDEWLAYIRRRYGVENYEKCIKIMDIMRQLTRKEKIDYFINTLRSNNCLLRVEK